MTVANPSEPVEHSACKIPTEAEELWIIAVNTRPASIPSTGLENIVRMCVNCGTSASGSTALLMASIPVIKMAKPTKILPMSCTFCFLTNIIQTTPIIAKTGEKDDGFNKLTNKLSPSIPVRLKIHEVAVVPIFAPIIMPTACDSRIMPELTKPTTITVVAEDDWMTAVTPAPSSTAFTGFDVNFSRILSSLPPDALERPSPIRCIP